MAQEIIISELTGDSVSTGKTKIEPTDEFVKVSKYLNVIFSYHNIPLVLVPISLLFAQRMTFKTNIVDLFKADREEIAETLGISEERTRSLIRECKKHNIIKQTKTRGKFEVNPFLFSTGSMVETRKLQAHFDFQNDVIAVNADQKYQVTGETVRKAVINKRDKQIPGQMSFEFGESPMPIEQKKTTARKPKKNPFMNFEQNKYTPEEYRSFDAN